MLVFAAIIPHSPVLLPSFDKQQADRFEKTTAALALIAQELREARPDTIVIISPHGPVNADHFTLDFNERYVCDLREFGVFDLGIPCRADMRLAHDLKEHAEDAGIPLMLRTGEGLDYGIGVPLSRLMQAQDAFSIIPITPSHLPSAGHHAFGKVIQDVIMHTNRRVAVLASAELSHRLTEDAPGGHDPRAASFDGKILKHLESGDTAAILELDQQLANDAGECGLTTIATYLGIIEGLHTRPELLSYEAPFGVGMAVVRHHLS